MRKFREILASARGWASVAAVVRRPRKALSRLAAWFVALSFAQRFLLGSALAATAAVTTVLTYVVFFDTSGEKGAHVYYNLVGEPTDAATRLLLMNRVKASSEEAWCVVDYANYNLNGATSPESQRNNNWWEDLNPEDTALLTTYNLAAGTQIRLHAKGNDGAVLWQIANCRMGNLNPKTTSGTPNSYQNLLPWSNLTYGFKGRTSTANQTTAGTLVMQNTPEAVVYSSCLPDGIGTVYFDAVNGFTGYKSGRLSVQVAYGVFKTNETGTVVGRNIPDDLELERDADGNEIAGRYVAPDDAHVDECRVIYQTETELEVETNAWARCAWVTANLVSCPVSHGAAQPLVTNAVAKMEMPLTGTAAAFDNFYRVWAPVQDPVVNPDLSKVCNGPMRFKIQRDDDPRKEGSVSAIDLDGSNLGSLGNVNGLLILDNIIASYPAMKAMAVPEGDYVPGGSSRNVIGWTGVFSTKYPKIGEKGLTVSAGFSFVTNAPPDEKATSGAWIADTKATMMHRMRYLSWTNAWEDIALAAKDGRLVSTDTVSLPGIPGDFEYYFDTVLDAPYYGYVDYSGTGLGTPGYTERIKHVESRYDMSGAPDGLPSTGTDFFTRLREGSSDQLEYQLEMRWLNAEKEYVVTNLPFYVASDRTWKTFVRTTTNKNSLVAFPVGTYQFRIVGIDPACTNVGATVTEIPWSAKALYPAPSPDSWTSIALDATTGALMFQLVENADPTANPSYTVVHAAYQDFNHWSDAASTATPPLYVGAFSETKGRQSGSSSDTRDFPSELPNWTASSGSNATYWTEGFVLSTNDTPEAGYGSPVKYPAYETFAECNTPNGWKARNSQWACSKWRESSKGGDMALQLGGDRDGSLEYVNAKQIPHGVDQYTLRARIAQSMQFSDFAYYFGGELEDMHDYLFTTRAVMGTTAADTAFDGNGSVSLVCCYQPGEGCYEMRAERTASNQVKLYLYKWEHVDGAKEITPRLLGRHRSNLTLYNSNGTSDATYLKSNKAGKTTSDQTSGRYGELFIRCTQSGSGVVVEGGVLYKAKSLGDQTGWTSGLKHYYIKYTDTTNPYTFGTCGFGTLNCPAQIIEPVFYANGAEATVPNVTSKCYDKAGKEISNPSCGSNDAVKFPTTGATYLFVDSTSSGRWKNWTYGSWLYGNKTVASLNAVEAKPPSGSLELVVTDSSSAVVTNLTRSLTGFTYTNMAFTVRNQVDSLVQLKTAKGSGDIVVDDCAFSQWCASSYGDSDRDDFKNLRPTFACPENYVYLNGWVSVEADGRHVIALQPLRAKKSGNEDGLLSIRAPLMDGRNDYAKDPEKRRGLGLGMFSFTYRNADAHCVIRAQYRPEDGSEDLARDTASTNGWIDVAVYDFSKMTDAERKGDTLQAYFGLHEYRGVMRLLVDPQVVKDSRDAAKNPGLDPSYGSIEITDFLSRDEPPIDGASWWGWNLRTTGAADERSLVDSDPTAAGMALSLNNGVTEGYDIEAETAELYPQHLPFVQTPDFGTNLVGEIAFRARRPAGMAAGVFTEVAILGAKSGGVGEDAEWHFMTNFLVKTDFYERYAYKTSASDGDYAAFRLAVIGVKGLSEGVPDYKDKMDPAVYPNPQRVLIDEVEVSEAVRGKIRLFDVGAFRSPLDQHTYVTNLQDVEQQPMCKETWSVQCEVRAVQLEEEVLLDDTTEVTLHWFATNSAGAKANWGYDSWKGSPAAKSGKLARIPEKPGFVYRGSYPVAPGGIAGPYFESGTVVQYVLEVRYKNSDGTVAAPYFLASGDWTKPEWYRGVEYNKDGGPFAAYTILDNVAYGYAWINEVNLYDGPGLWDDPQTNQFVEVAVPAEGDIKDWELRFITGGLGDDAPFYTNTVVVFVDPERMSGGVPCRKSQHVERKYAFITAGTTKSCSDALKAAGVIDGPLLLDSGAYGVQLTPEGTGGGFTINVGMPLGVQLVRPSGIVEHEIVVAGTNRYSSARDPRPRVYSATNFVARLQALDPNGSWYFTGYDHDDDPTLGMSVTNFTGVITDAGVWSHVTKTPGRINENEYIPPEHPHPQGEMIVLYAQLENGYIDQTVCEKVNATENITVYVPKGLKDGTNITYRVANWHALAELSETGEKGPVAHPEAVDRTGTFSIAVAKNASNDVTVVAKTKVRRDLTEQYGLDAGNAYAPAVLDWLETGLCGKTPKAFANPGGEIRLAEFQKMDGSFDEEPLDLTTMYWLDMDPTVGGSVLQAGMCDPPSPTLVDRPHVGDGEGTVVTNDVCQDIVLGVMMKIWNKDGKFGPYAPYTLNGIEPGSSSRIDGATNWDSVTFKITGYLQNGKDAQKPPDQIWKPMRYFVFDEGSFDENFQAKIQVADPFWLFNDWVEFKDCPVYFRWALDTRKYGAVSSEILRPDSTY